MRVAPGHVLHLVHSHHRVPVVVDGYMPGVLVFFEYANSANALAALAVEFGPLEEVVEPPQAPGLLPMTYLRMKVPGLALSPTHQCSIDFKRYNGPIRVKHTGLQIGKKRECLIPTATDDLHGLDYSEVVGPS